MVPGGGVEPPRPEGRRILSVMTHSLQVYALQHFCDLHLTLQRDWCGSD
jgi:hypothetical protein